MPQKRQMNRCSNCLIESEEVFVVLSDKKYFGCPKCLVTYAKDRDGNAFMMEEEVFISHGYHPKTNGRLFVIKGIYIMEECESGRMIYLIDKETGNNLKSVLDTNWLIKIKN